MNRVHHLSPRAQSLLLAATLAVHEKLCAARRAAGQHEVLVLGDSHVLPFLRMGVPYGLDGEFFRVVSVEGATVSGLPNPNSRTGAAQRFTEALADSNARTVLVNLGEVDTGFVIWYRAQRDGQSVEAMLEQALDRYQELVAQIASQGRQAIVISAPLPTIGDGPAPGIVANQRSTVQVPQAERTALTLRFNASMRRWCTDRGVRHLDLDPDSVDPATGRIRTELLSPDPSDHHYAREAYRRLLEIALARPGR